jgi:hypothetical protein
MLIRRLRRFSQIKIRGPEEWCVEDTPYEKLEDAATKNAKSHKEEAKERYPRKLSVPQVTPW